MERLKWWTLQTSDFTRQTARWSWLKNFSHDRVTCLHNKIEWMNRGKNWLAVSVLLSDKILLWTKLQKAHIYFISTFFLFSWPPLFALLSVLGYNTAAVDAPVASALCSITVFSRMLTLPWRPPRTYLVTRKLLNWSNSVRGDAVLFLTGAFLFVLGHVGQKSIDYDKHFRHKRKDSQWSVYIAVS